MYLKISKFLEKLSFKLRQISLYYEFKFYVVNGENHFIRAYKHNRGIGKTYTLVRLAHKYNCPIFVSTRSMGNYIEKMYRDEFNESVMIIVVGGNCRGMRFDLGICEEGIDEDSIYLIVIPMCKQVIGYKSIY